MICRVELLGVRINGQPAFVGWCRACVAELLRGFDRAEALARSS
jgi:hypothetical protein